MTQKPILILQDGRVYWGSGFIFMLNHFFVYLDRIQAYYLYILWGWKFDEASKNNILTFNGKQDDKN